MSTKKKPTAQQKQQRAQKRRDEMDALHQRLTSQVEALRDSQEWARYLAFCTSFHAYSFGNLLLIMSQRPDATTVAGYRRWQQLGRQVRAGERGIRIIGGRTVQVADDDEEDGTRNGVRFFPTSVFDISQTEPIPDQEDLTATHPAKPLHGDDQHGIYAAVGQHLNGQGWPMRRDHLDGANGRTYPDTREVIVSDALSEAHAAKTALHEAAHIALGHVDDFAEYVAHRGRFEVEAESVAFIIAGSLGLDTSDYSTGYVATWAQDAESDVLQATAERVRTTAHALREALDTSTAHPAAA